MLQALGVVTIGELQRVPKATLQAEFGAEGLRIWSSARGLDTSSVGQSAKGVSAAVGAKAVATLANAELPRQTVLTGRAARVIGLLHKVAL
jgi:nucleotidyltransferase/DNA polymerase involved in DNA repair